MRSVAPQEALRPIEALGARLREGDLPQVAALCLAVLIAVLALAWPSRPGAANEAWAVVAQGRSVIVALLALSYGVISAFVVARRTIFNALAVMMVAMSLIPIELLAHAGSVPLTPSWWAWLSTPLAVTGQMSVGALAAIAFAKVGLRALTPLLPLTLVAGFIALDYRLDFTLLNPLSSALRISPAYLIVMAVLTALGVVALVASLVRRPKAVTEA